MQVLAAVLAAGGGSRARRAGATPGDGADGHKLVARRDGRHLYRVALDAAFDADIGAVVLVTGAVALEPPLGVRVVHNARWADGQATSLRVAIEAAEAVGADALVVGLADQPGIPSSAWRAVADAPDDRPVVVATYGGRRGPHPVRLARSVWELLPTSGDEGARTLLRQRPELVHEVPCDGVPADIDTAEDLERWISS